MYCSKCASPINDTLKYCKNCGVKLVKDEGETPKSILDNLLTTLCFVVLGGLGILVGLAAVLLEKGINPSAVAVISVFYLATLAAVCYLLLSQLPKVVDASLNKTAEKTETVEPVRLAAPTTAQLEEHREPLSVTENTTRNFEKIPLKQD
jgi:hypothetical protein